MAPRFPGAGAATPTTPAPVSWKGRRRHVSEGLMLLTGLCCFSAYFLNSALWGLLDFKSAILLTWGSSGPSLPLGGGGGKLMYLGFGGGGGVN